jgi:hypothetical protein
MSFQFHFTKEEGLSSKIRSFVPLDMWNDQIIVFVYNAKEKLLLLSSNITIFTFPRFGGHQIL